MRVAADNRVLKVTGGRRASGPRALRDITNTGDNGKDPLLGAGAAFSGKAFATGPYECMKPRASQASSGASQGTTCSTRTSTPPTFDQVKQDDDENCPRNPQNVAEYAHDIYGMLERYEGHRLPGCNYMDRQPDLNAKMRAILVDWLVEVGMKHKLKRETLFLTVNLIDRSLDQRQTMRQRLQLVGVAAMLIASKFEEINPPEISDFVYITDNAYTKEDILQMEVLILTDLKFAICVPTPAHFLERFQRLNQCPKDSAHRHLLHYLLELSLMDFQMIRYEPSHLVAAATLLSNKLMKQQPSWPPMVARHCKFDLPAVRDCAQEMCSILEAAQKSPLQAVRKKFSHVDFCSVATLPWW
mmetsp:Transcript_68485/g.185031  ORF Transcript_68485/g.185031 Transcript_68485/m.185031 type:complete len:357 (-) Transcript_68485:222-1292(-)